MKFSPKFSSEWKSITYPTDSNLAIKIINRFNKIGSAHDDMSTAARHRLPVPQKGNLIVGVVSHEQNLHDSHTLPAILHHVEIPRGKAAKQQAVCDRGYRGKVEVNGTQIILPGKAFKKDTRYQKDKKRKSAGGVRRLNPLSAT
ncbi:MAG: hypothetical protein ABL861_06630 [Nitrosomonas sp.]